MSIFGLFSAGNDYDIISEQILEYYRFHKKIESIFLNKNTNEKDAKEELYFINPDWIKKWKLYTNYDEAIKYLDKDINKSMLENIIFKNNSLYPYNFSLEKSNDFLNKTLLKAIDFESIVNKKLYNLYEKFYNYRIFSFFNIFNAESIKAIFSENMLILLIDKYKRIKVIYTGDL